MRYRLNSPKNSIFIGKPSIPLGSTSVMSQDIVDIQSCAEVLLGQRPAGLRWLGQ